MPTPGGELARHVGLSHHVRLTESGNALLGRVGVDVAAIEAGSRPTARRCLDWTERRHHPDGAAGAALLDAMIDNGWIARGPRPRAVRVTKAGTTHIARDLGVR